MTNIIIEPGETIEHGSQPRYRVTRPVPGGYAYWNVIDTSEPNLPHCATIWENTRLAGNFAVLLSKYLNLVERASMLKAKKGSSNA